MIKAIAIIYSVALILTAVNEMGIKGAMFLGTITSASLAIEEVIDRRKNDTRRVY